MATDPETLSRIIEARRKVGGWELGVEATISAYEANSLPPLDRPLVEQEIQVLRSIIKEHPHKAATLESLVLRCEALLGH